MAKKFVRSDAEMREAEVAKMMRLRALRLAKEKEDAEEKATATKLKIKVAARPRRPGAAA